MYTDPHILIAYDDGEVRQELTLLYAADIEHGELKVDDESTEAVWVSLAASTDLPLARSQRQRILDVQDYLNEHRAFLR